jgi:hypothetical protein
LNDIAADHRPSSCHGIVGGDGTRRCMMRGRFGPSWTTIGFGGFTGFGSGGLPNLRCGSTSRASAASLTVLVGHLLADVGNLGAHLEHDPLFELVDVGPAAIEMQRQCRRADGRSRLSTGGRSTVTVSVIVLVPAASR